MVVVVVVVVVDRVVVVDGVDGIEGTDGTDGSGSGVGVFGMLGSFGVFVDGIEGSVGVVGVVVVGAGTVSGLPGYGTVWASWIGSDGGFESAAYAAATAPPDRSSVSAAIVAPARRPGVRRARSEALVPQARHQSCSCSSGAWQFAQARVTAVVVVSSWADIAGRGYRDRGAGQTASGSAASGLPETVAPLSAPSASSMPSAGSEKSVIRSSILTSRTASP